MLSLINTIRIYAQRICCMHVLHRLNDTNTSSSTCKILLFKHFTRSIYLYIVHILCSIMFLQSKKIKVLTVSLKSSLNNPVVLRYRNIIPSAGKYQLAIKTDLFKYWHCLGMYNYVYTVALNQRFF